MQVRFVTFSAIAALLSLATPAIAQEIPTLAELQARGACPELPVCGHCSADTKTGRSNAAAGGAEASQDVFVTEAARPPQSATPDQVQTAPQANMPIFLELDGVPGESSETPRSPPPPPPPPPQNAPTAQQGIQASSAEQAALLVPAVQRVRDAATRSRPANDGVVVLDTSLPQGAATARDPEMPICAHCGADAQVGAQQQPAAEEQPRRRGRFSLSIGGVTVSSDGGVNIDAGEIIGNGRGSERQSAGRQHAPVRPVRE